MTELFSHHFLKTEFSQLGISVVISAYKAEPGLRWKLVTTHGIEIHEMDLQTALHDLAKRLLELKGTNQ